MTEKKKKREGGKFTVYILPRVKEFMRKLSEKSRPSEHAPRKYSMTDVGEQFLYSGFLTLNDIPNDMKDEYNEICNIIRLWLK